MADAGDLEQDAWNFARRAVKCDQEAIVETAIFYYRVSLQDTRCECSVDPAFILLT